MRLVILEILGIGGLAFVLGYFTHWFQCRVRDRIYRQGHADGHAAGEQDGKKKFLGGFR